MVPCPPGAGDAGPGLAACQLWHRCGDSGAVRGCRAEACALKSTNRYLGSAGQTRRILKRRTCEPRATALNPLPAQHRLHRWRPRRDQRGRSRRTRCLSREARGCSGQPASDNMSAITYPQGIWLASTRPRSCCSHCRRKSASGAVQRRCGGSAGQDRSGTPWQR